MKNKEKEAPSTSTIKIVYFHEASASEYLDIYADGKNSLRVRMFKERSKEAHG